MRTLSCPDFQTLMTRGAQLVDVRLPEEVAIAALPGAINIPLHELPSRLDDLDPAQPVAVFCHHGVRSEQASRFLESRGFGDVSHLAGGIDAWALEMARDLPRY